LLLTVAVAGSLGQGIPACMSRTNGPSGRCPRPAAGSKATPGRTASPMRPGRSRLSLKMAAGRSRRWWGPMRPAASDGLIIGSPRCCT